MATSDLAELTPRRYTALVIRTALGVLYVSHALLMWAIFGTEHATQYLTYAELAGGLLLSLGFYVRVVSLALIPVAAGGAFAHLASGVGLSFLYGLYLAGCLAGQAVLASGILDRGQNESSELTLPSW